jgi:hypothetical protein
MAWSRAGSRGAVSDMRVAHGEEKAFTGVPGFALTSCLP